jgi:hypothetical protein
MTNRINLFVICVVQKCMLHYHFLQIDNPAIFPSIFNFNVLSNHALPVCEHAEIYHQFLSPYL